MLGSQARAATSAIVAFCEELLKEYGTPQLVWPETIAERFSEYFGVVPPIRKEELLYLCEEIGLQYPVGMSLPAGVRGMHIGYDDTFMIFYEDGEWEGGVRHTVLHEIWEIINHILDSYVPCDLLSAKDKESRAHKFAAAVLMPRERFLESCVRMSYNPLMLREKYWQSYHSILIRMRDVVGRETAFVGLLYENAVLNEYFKQWGSPMVPDILSEVNRGYNFRVSCNTFSHHFRSAPDVLANLPCVGEWVDHGNFFHDIAMQAVEENDVLRHFRMSLMSSMLFGSYPVINGYGTIEKVLVTGIDEDGWESLRRMMTTSSL